MFTKSGSQKLSIELIKTTAEFDMIFRKTCGIYKILLIDCLLCF